ncbi:MurT ligase domain-containing protein [Rothia sp. AR01]|uniref:Lipid II isoglutaminyl synthase (glutamine-hydrolyzing) subunit MurT n=1 Tax=Rothia santali TaxID=2949643 RepID=A0A9X2KJH7_9MICC|nr:Mur ligase family protein [Rothia santali]MCP3427238.1 MurT ligase domain-containing protein [Rothia santali]
MPTPRFLSPVMRPVTRLIGQGIRYASARRGGGSAFPGLVMEKIDPGFVARQLATLPRGVVVVSGTNGKTTTTKMTVQLLESQGLRVFTNRTGSNFVRGVAAALLERLDVFGRLNADIAVLELDEAHAVHFVKLFPPRYALLLNVMRDQLDRFGEIDTTRKMLAKVAAATTGTVVLNREDPRIRRLAEDVRPGTGIAYYGLSEALRERFPSDDEMRDKRPAAQAADLPEAGVVLQSFEGTDTVLRVGDREVRTDVHLYGIYNIFNAAGALALTLEVMGEEAREEVLLEELSRVTPAFGRGESVRLGDRSLQLLLVKNPAGFRLSLASATGADYATMITINDEYADGRDVSWLWDVDFDTLAPGGVDVVSGTRAYDMALRLEHDDVAVGAVDTDLRSALRRFVEGSGTQPMRVFCTYTSMLALRRELATMTEVEEI